MGPFRPAAINCQRDAEYRDRVRLVLMNHSVEGRFTRSRESRAASFASYEASLMPATLASLSLTVLLRNGRLPTIKAPVTTANTTR